MKKKFATWLNGVVDRAIVSEAFCRARAAEERLQTIVERCDVYETTIRCRNEQVARLIHESGDLQESLRLANSQVALFKQRTDELEGRIGNALL